MTIHERERIILTEAMLFSLGTALGFFMAGTSAILAIVELGVISNRFIAQNMPYALAASFVADILFWLTGRQSREPAFRLFSFVSGAAWPSIVLYIILEFR